MQGLDRLLLAFVLCGAGPTAVQQSGGAQAGSTGTGPQSVETKAETPEKAKPKIQSTEFGSITVNGKVYAHDVLIRLDGQVEKRKKKLSKQETGTGHLISLDEARHVYQEGAARLIVGSGQSGVVKLSPEAADYFKSKGCAVELLPTPAAIAAWNEARGAVIGLFHVTC